MTKTLGTMTAYLRMSDIDEARRAARELLFAVVYYAIALLAAIGLGVVANVLGGLFQ